MQYLLSVIHDQLELSPSDEMAAIDDVFNDRLQADGHWVFAGGLGFPDTATVIDNGESPQWSPTGPSWSPRVPRRLLDHRSPRPRRGAQTRRRGVEGLQP